MGTTKVGSEITKRQECTITNNGIVFFPKKYSVELIKVLPLESPTIALINADKTKLRIQASPTGTGNKPHDRDGGVFVSMGKIITSLKLSSHDTKRYEFTIGKNFIQIDLTSGISKE